MLYYPSLFVIGDKNDMWPFLPPELWSLLKGDDTSSESQSLMQPLRMHDYIPLSELGVNDMSSKSWRINLEKCFVPSSCPTHNVYFSDTGTNV